MSIVERGEGGIHKECNLKGVMIVLKANRLLWVGFPKRVFQGYEGRSEKGCFMVAVGIRRSAISSGNQCYNQVSTDNGGCRPWKKVHFESMGIEG